MANASVLEYENFFMFSASYRSTSKEYRLVSARWKPCLRIALFIVYFDSHEIPRYRKCPKCATLQSAKKEMAISSPPWLLLLHLKRFTYGESGQKIHKAVSYPLKYVFVIFIFWSFFDKMMRHELLFTARSLYLPWLHYPSVIKVLFYIFTKNPFKHYVAKRKYTWSKPRWKYSDYVCYWVDKP